MDKINIKGEFLNGKKILILISQDTFFLSHFLEITIRLQEAGG